MLRHARRRLKVRISKLEFSLGVRLALSAVLAMVAGQMLGLHAFYWAGISAIIVSTGTPGGSFQASLRRFAGTVVGLLVGVLSVWMLGHTLWAAALAIPLAILIAQAVGLKTSVKVAALSTLFPIALVAEAHGLGATMATVVSRAENVLLGCVMTLVIDGLVWPGRVADKILGQVQKDLIEVGRLLSEVLEGYAAGKDRNFDAGVLALQTARLTYSDLLKELGSEAEDRDTPRETLASQVEILHQLVDHCAALRDIQRRTHDDQVQQLLREDLEDLAAEIRATTEAFGRNEPGFHQRLALLRATGLRLEASYEGVRGDKGTQTFPSQEVFRLLGVLYLCGALVRTLEQLEPEAEEELEAVEG